MPGEVNVTTPTDREVVVTREFNAAPDLVFEAFTRPELVKRWLNGPSGWSMVRCDIDLRVGGRYRYEWTHDGGGRMGMSGTYSEVTAPSRIASTELFDEDWTGGEADVSADFTALKQGRTLLTQTSRYSSQEARDGALATGMTEGMSATFYALDALLGEVSAQSSSR